jgi:hypothetical protein
LIAYGSGSPHFIRFSLENFSKKKIGAIEPFKPRERKRNEEYLLPTVVTG